MLLQGYSELPLLLFASLVAPLAQAQLHNFNGPPGGRPTNANLTLQMIQQRADMWLGQVMQSR